MGVTEAIYEFEQGKTLPFTKFLISVEGKMVRSFEELQKIAADNQDKEFLEVKFIPIFGGG